jgi:hypothetical protein
MNDWVKRALTKKVHTANRGKQHLIIVEPNEKLVYTVKFALGMTGFLSAVEVAHIIFLHTWNSEVFAAITGLIGTVTGVLIGQQA